MWNYSFFRFPSKNFLFLKESFFGMVFETAFSLSERTFVGEIELFRKDTSFDAHCRTLSRHYSDFSQEFSAQFLRQHSLCPNGNFEGKIFLSKMKLLMNAVRHWAKMCWLLAKNVRLGGQSCLFRVEENFFAENERLHKNFSPNTIFWTMSGSFSGLWRKKLR